MQNKRLSSIIFALKNYQAALVAALFFGGIAPGAKYLIRDLPPQSMAGVLYLSAGIGLLAILALKKEVRASIGHFQKKDGKWLIAATFFGGILGPAFLMYGMIKISGSTASLLLNLEAVLTSVIAWSIFKEHFEKKIVFGMLFIVMGCVVLSLASHGSSGQDSLMGFILIALACLSWGIDNNVTRNISHLNPIFTASVKGLVAGGANLIFGFFIGERLNFDFQLFLAGLLGFFGIGVSLVAFIMSLRKIGTSRTGAIFSTAPFIGSIISIFYLGESISVSFIIALGLMVCGVCLHLNENHEHEHLHTKLEHSHEHIHDEHHQHSHTPNDPPREPHVHLHRHDEMTHRHPHFPDIHHQHSH